MIMGHNLSLKIAWTELKCASISIKSIFFSFGPMEISMSHGNFPVPWKIPWPMEISMLALNAGPWNFPWVRAPYVSLDSQ